MREVHQILNERLSLEELRTLCFHLGVDYEDLGGEGKGAKIRELILYLERRGTTARLIEWLREERKDIVLSAQLGGATPKPAEAVAPGRSRCADLAAHIHETLNLIKQYEERRLLSDDPREQRRAERAIGDLRAQLASFEAESQALGCKEGG